MARTAARGRPTQTSSRWSWSAFAAALVVWIAALPTFGLSVVLAPLTLLLSLVAWRRAPHDAVFWLGAVLNGLLALSLLGLIVAVLTGESSIGWE
jgi:hypothetical protein